MKAAMLTNGTGSFTATFNTVASQTITAKDAANGLAILTGPITVTIPNLVVTTATSDSGTASMSLASSLGPRLLAKLTFQPIGTLCNVIGVLCWAAMVAKVYVGSGWTERDPDRRMRVKTKGRSTGEFYEY